MSFKGMPKRLIYVSLMNIAVALLGLVALGFLLTGKNAPSDAVPGPLSAVVSAALSFSLLWQSIKLFSASQDNRRKLFAAALAFFGALICQQLWALYLYRDSITDPQARHVYTNIARHFIELGLNWWALFSGKTSQFFQRVNGLQTD